MMRTTVRAAKASPASAHAKPASATSEYSTLKYPLSTEKSIRMLEAENKLLFVVDTKATRKDIKKAVEELFKVKVSTVNTIMTQHGEKRAYVKLTPEFPAIDIATDLGLM